MGGECASWCDVLLHIVPAKVAGTWRGEGIQLDLSQAYQKVLGTVTASGATTTIESGNLAATSSHSRQVALRIPLESTATA